MSESSSPLPCVGGIRRSSSHNDSDINTGSKRESELAERLVRDVGSAELAGGDDGVAHDRRAEHVGMLADNSDLKVLD